jgi:hypothetical protein
VAISTRLNLRDFMILTPANRDERFGAPHHSRALDDTNVTLG